jgi:uncharacterized protein (DUF433 family)
MSRLRAPLPDRIVVDPDILVGKPVVKGTRIPVELVLKRLAQDPDFAALFEAYPRLTREDVQACLEYAQKVIEAQPPSRAAPRRTAATPA